MYEQLEERLKQLLPQEQVDELLQLAYEYGSERFQEGRDYEWSAANDGPVY